MRKTVLSLLCALSLLLTLTSCGKEPEAAQSPQSVLEAAGGLSAEETLLTVDGREVAAWQYLYWLAEVTDGIRSYYEGAQKPLDWSEPLEDGTLGDYAKDQALKSAALYATVETWGAALRLRVDGGGPQRHCRRLGRQGEGKRRRGELSYAAGPKGAGPRRRGASGPGPLSLLELSSWRQAAGPLWRRGELPAFPESGY